LPALFFTKSSPYSLLLLVAIAASLFTWTRLARRDHRLVLIYVAALLSAFIGAKLVYVLAEGWLDWPMPDRWLRLATGKSVLGALLGGYAGVELAKHALGHRAATGDLFALVAPLGIAIGRVGCLLHGCCLGERVGSGWPAWWRLCDAQGVARWPAVPLELAFNIAAIVIFLLLRSRAPRSRACESAGTSLRETSGSNSEAAAGISPRSHERGYAMRGQHFHLYLIGYGAFRFAHEWMRATPKIAGVISSYQLAALACGALGVWGFRRRARLADATTACLG
jgi:phosphatidylglycerol:prolipoprotein diacylglycerol transferase